jgi:hypothetical protein
LIDAYNRDWRFVLSEQKNRVTDNEGFKQIYVQKDKILSEEQVFHNGSSRSAQNSDNKRSKSKSKGYYYRAKSKDVKSELIAVPEDGPMKVEKKAGGNNMKDLLSGLMADDTAYNKFTGHTGESDEDEDVTDFVERRNSSNQFNVMGMNLKSYQDQKPSAGVRREILNMFNEYKESENKEHAKGELVEICQKYEIEKSQFLGYFLNNSLAEKPEDFRQYLNLAYEYFYEDLKLLDSKQMLDSVNVCCANLPDLIIDYPNAKLYANEMIAKSLQHKIMTEAESTKYIAHIEGLEA